MISKYLISSLLYSPIAKWREKCHGRGKRLSALKLYSSTGQQSTSCDKFGWNGSLLNIISHFLILIILLLGENFKFLSKFPCLHIYLHLGFQELDGKPASPTPVIVASHTANKEEKVGQTSYSNLPLPHPPPHQYLENT